MRFWVVAIGVGLGLAACHRAAEEPPSPDAQASLSPSALSPTDPASPRRCVSPTPAASPPPVPPGPAPGCPHDPQPHTLDLVTVQFPEATSGAVTVKAELARTFPERERGLMFRTSMEDDRGMLFDQGERKVQEFWMRNTCIPLDMIFIDEDGFVVGIVENVPTLNELPRSVPCPSTYVLEVNAGWSRRHGVRAGSIARLPGA